jgi:hypothetical protein
MEWGGRQNYIPESIENMRPSGDIQHIQQYDNKPVC